MMIEEMTTSGMLDGDSIKGMDDEIDVTGSY